MANSYHAMPIRYEKRIGRIRILLLKDANVLILRGRKELNRWKHDSHKEAAKTWQALIEGDKPDTAKTPKWDYKTELGI